MLTEKEKRNLVELGKQEVLTSENVLTLLDLLGINYSVIDKDGNYIIQNGTMVKHISAGLTNAAIIDKSSWDNCKEVMTQQEIKIIDEFFKGRWFLSIKKPLIANNSVLGIAILSLDVTDRKQAEIKASQLEKEKITAEVKSQIIADLASSIAHEIGNLLSGIIIHEQLLSQRLKPRITECAKQRNESDREIKELLNTLEESLGNAKYMFESIKMNIRHGNIDKSQFVLADIAEDIEAVLNSCFPNEQKVAAIKWNKEQCFEYLGIPAYTRNVLINLIKNALYFIKEEKRGDISIALKKGEKFNELIFEDTAKGISAEALPKLFTRFSTTRRGGTGMGLAFCKMVMQEYGGDIVCESEFEKYTKFILTFPMIIVE